VDPRRIPFFVIQNVARRSEESPNQPNYFVWLVNEGILRRSAPLNDKKLGDRGEVGNHLNKTNKGPNDHSGPYFCMNDPKWPTDDHCLSCVPDPVPARI
jgi:hypothetical protein